MFLYIIGYNTIIIYPLSYYRMKMQSQNKNIRILLVLWVLWFFINFYHSVFAADSIWYTFSNQSANQNGSNNSLISVGSYLEYMNRGDNSSIIGNYFRGYYYDSVFGFFKMDWSSNQNQNVRIVSSTSQCSNGYGYKLGGFAYSTIAGFVDFDYNQNIFVYYCVQDEKLYGYAYSSTVGFQNFQGISFDIESIPSPPAVIAWTGVFTNDTSNIKNPTIETQNPITPAPNGQAINSNFTPNTIQANKVEFEALRESLFYIIK